MQGARGYQVQLVQERQQSPMGLLLQAGKHRVKWQSLQGHQPLRPGTQWQDSQLQLVQHCWRGLGLLRRDCVKYFSSKFKTEEITNENQIDIVKEIFDDIAEEFASLHSCQLEQIEK